jgi:hypothetical protein
MRFVTEPANVILLFAIDTEVAESKNTLVAWVFPTVVLTALVIVGCMLLTTFETTAFMEYPPVAPAAGRLLRRVFTFDALINPKDEIVDGITILLIVEYIVEIVG